MDGAVFAVLGLLIAFTFSGATARFDTRRQLIVEETNDIGTAYLRLAPLPADAQPPLRQAFRDYLAARIETYRRQQDPQSIPHARVRAGHRGSRQVSIHALAQIEQGLIERVHSNQAKTSVFDVEYDEHWLPWRD